MAQPTLQPTLRPTHSWPQLVDQPGREPGASQSPAALQRLQTPGRRRESRRGRKLATAGAFVIAGAIGAVASGSWLILLAVLAGAVVAGAIAATVMIWVMNNVDPY